MTVGVAPVTVTVICLGRRIVEQLVGRDPEHVLAQGHPQCGPLVVAHHGQIELDLLDPGHSPGHPVHLVRQLVGPRPGGDGQREFDPGPTPSDLHLAEEAEAAEGQAEFGLLDRVQRRREL